MGLYLTEWPQAHLHVCPSKICLQESCTSTESCARHPGEAALAGPIQAPSLTFPLPLKSVMSNISNKSINHITFLLHQLAYTYSNEVGSKQVPSLSLLGGDCKSPSPFKIRENVQASKWTHFWRLIGTPSTSAWQIQQGLMSHDQKFDFSVKCSHPFLINRRTATPLPALLRVSGAACSW